MQEIKTKEDIYQCICSAASLGTLGLFVGSGFTKAILKEKETMLLNHNLS